jgi:hypothetical protein
MSHYLPPPPKKPLLIELRSSRQWLWRMPSSGTRHRVVLVKNRRFGGTLFLPRWCFRPDNGGARFLRRVGSRKSHTESHFRRRYCWQTFSTAPVSGRSGTETSVKNGVFWDVTPCGSCKNIPEDTILHSYRRENLQSYETSVFKISLNRWLLT